MPEPAPLTPGQINVTSWLHNLLFFSGGPLASTPESVALDHDTFYAKSLTTPSDEPIPAEAITAMASWLSFEGWYTTTVRSYLYAMTTACSLCLSTGRTGSCSCNCGEVQLRMLSRSP